MDLQNPFSSSGRTNAKNIFISYRVQDTAGETGRLVDALKERFSEKHIFIDIEKIEPGLDFSQVISRSLDSCDVMLAVIGPNWMGALAPDKTPRIQNPNDWVRIEICAALKRNIRIIPILVDGGCLPQADQLPEDLVPLLRRQAYEISNKRWKYDTDRLLDFLENTVGVPAKIKKEKRGPGERPWLRRHWIAIFSFTALVFFAWLLIDNDTPSTEPGVEPVYDSIQPFVRADSIPLSQPNNPDKGPDLPVEVDHLTAGEEETPLSIQGTWMDTGGNFIVFIQNNTAITLTGFNLEGLPIGSGSGVINNGEISFAFFYQDEFTSENLSCKLELSADGMHMNGTQTYQSTSITTPINLSKVE